MNEKFKEYTDKGFEFFIGHDDHDSKVQVIHAVWNGGQFCGCEKLYEGDNLDHAFAACDLLLLEE